MILNTKGAQITIKILAKLKSDDVKNKEEYNMLKLKTMNITARALWVHKCTHYCWVHS